MFTWDPSREAFRLPYLDVPILWYGLFFALSFYLGYYIFVHLLTFYFSQFPEVLPQEIKAPEKLLDKVRGTKGKKASALLYLITKGEKVSSIQKLRTLMNRFIHTEKNWEDLSFIEGSKGKWRRKHFLISPKKAALRVYLETVFKGALSRLQERAIQFSDRLLMVMIFCTLFGARFFHLFFYRPSSVYLNAPWKIFTVWEGGLASHGAAFAIIFGVYLFSRYGQSQQPKLPFMSILDLISVPAAFVGGWVRIGNFFNQELLGKPTNLPWAVAFGHPFDGSTPLIPRHPVQLYEAGCYFLIFLILCSLALRTTILLRAGKLTGLFFLMIFSFRFVVEFLKERQSFLSMDTTLSMGQMLSIPFCILGLFCVLFSYRVPGKKRL